MGVMASYCQLCGLPVQHDHYVATERSDSWSIYRSSHPGDTKPSIIFGPEHQWLTQGVGLSPYQEEDPVMGFVEDGHLEDESGEPHFVCRGNEDLALLHRACWEIAGSPRCFQAIGSAPRLHQWVLLSRYQEQLFEFERLIKDGRGAWLVDPNSSEGAESRQRIQAWLAEARRVAGLPPIQTARQLAESNSWAREDVVYQGEHSFWRYRDNVVRGLDLQGKEWVNLGICLPFQGKADGPHTLALEHFESKMLQVLEPLAVVLACRGKVDRWDYLCYTDLEGACQQAILELGGPDVEFDSLSEPNWENYWTHLHPHLAGRYEEYESP